MALKKVAPSPSLVTPYCVLKVPSLTVFFNTRFTIPDIASEPYCAAAPSLKISIRSTASDGMLFKSVTTVPLPIVTLLLIAENWCLLFPFIKTNDWSGDMPFNVAGSAKFATPFIPVLAELNEGDVNCAICPKSVWPVACNSFALTTSTGTGRDTSVRGLLLREPITVTASRLLSLIFKVIDKETDLLKTSSVFSYPTAEIINTSPSFIFNENSPAAFVVVPLFVPFIVTLAFSIVLPSLPFTWPLTGSAVISVSVFSVFLFIRTVKSICL